MNTDSIEGVVPYHTHTHIYIYMYITFCVCGFGTHVRVCDACAQSLPAISSSCGS